MTSQSTIVEKMNTLLDETINITPECVMHLHDHRNKVVPFMKPSILVDLRNGVKFRSYTCWMTNDIKNHCLLCWVNNHHISNKNLVLSTHVKIGL